MPEITAARRRHLTLIGAIGGKAPHPNGRGFQLMTAEKRREASLKAVAARKANRAGK